MMRFHHQTLAVFLMVAVLLTHSAEAKAKSVQDAQKRLSSMTNGRRHGPAPVDLGTAADFAILTKTGVTTVPASAITGDVGVSPGVTAAFTGFSLTAIENEPWTTSTQVTGRLYAADKSPTPAKMTTAVSDMEKAYDDAAGRANPDFLDHEGGALGGQTLAPGLYKFTTNVGFSDADCTISGTATDTWIFQIAGDMTIAANKRITLAGGALAKNIVWVVAGTTTFGAGSHFEGIILGKTNAAFITGSSINGRVLVQTAATLQVTTVVKPTE